MAARCLLKSTVESEHIIITKSFPSQITRLTGITHHRTGLASRFLGNRRKPINFVLDRSVDCYQAIGFCYQAEFTLWRERKTSANEAPFLSCIIAEDIRPYLNFNNAESFKLLANKANTLELKVVSEAKPVTKTYALSVVPRLCSYEMRVNSDTE
ncbi:hypothetical protein DINM_005017 [Dirofilaria immitis]|nr:hypothetical protein [Dirofilaria immitis]